MEKLNTQQHSHAKIIGLTGGIACGKSTVAKLFAKRGIDIIDADLIARHLLKTNNAAYQQTVDHFGRKIINLDGSINRSKLAEIIFNNPLEKEWLNSLLHPLVRKEIQCQILQARSPYIILDIPLLTENRKQYPFLDKVLVIDATIEQQIKRAMARSGLSESQVRSIISNQASREKRLEIADDVISNHGSIKELEKSVDKIHEKYGLL